MLEAVMITVLLTLGGTLQGTVRAEGTREPIAHARIEIQELGRTASTDADGYFVIADVPEGRWIVRATALGYDTVQLTIASAGTGGMRLGFLLPRRPVRVGEVSVRGAAVRASGTTVSAASAGPAPARLAGPGQLKYIPGIAEPDVLRALQQLPSVAAISDFSSALYVRGGAADQNLIMLDGVPLFNPYHLGGVFSAINADAVAGVDVWAGALPAREGDRLASAVRIDTRDGGRDRTRASGAIGLVSSNATVDGPIGSRASYLLSARRTYIDAASRGMYAMGIIDQTLPYGFWDLLMKGTYDVGSLGRLAFTGYLNREGVSFPQRMREVRTGDAQLGWGSRVAAISFRHPIGTQLMWSSRVAVTDFTGTFDFWDWGGGAICDQEGCVELPGDTTHDMSAGTTARDIIAESELAWHGRRHTLRTGIRRDDYAFRHRLERPSVDTTSRFHNYGLMPPFRNRSRAATVAAFLEDEWRVSDRLQLRGGLRLLHAGSLGTAWLPRVGARFRLLPNLWLAAGGGRYAQAVRSMRTDESVVSSFIAYDVLSMQPVEAGLGRGDDIVAGLEFDDGTTSARLEAYVKRMNGLVLPRRFTNPMDLPPLVIDTFRIGTGTARGVELSVRRSFGRLELNASYAYGHAERTVDGETFVPRFERRHTADIGAQMPWGSTGLLTAGLTAATGQPFTRVVGLSPLFRFNPITGDFEDRGSPTFIMGEYNAARLPAYYRLDVAARRAYDKRWFGRDMQITPYVQVLNVLNTRNVLLSEPQQFPQRYEHLPQLPIFPTFGVEWRF